MNPFTEPLSRQGFAFWSLLYFAGLYAAFTARQKGWVNIGEGSSGAGIAAAYLLIAVFIALSLLILARRLQDTKLSIWLVVLPFIPYIGFIFWGVLFFVPSKDSGSNRPQSP